MYALRIICTNKYNKKIVNDNKKTKLEKSKNKCSLRYLILQYGSYSQLYLTTLFIKINFLFNQKII
jgi:hypothetical protein